MKILIPTVSQSRTDLTVIYNLRVGHKTKESSHGSLPAFQRPLVTQAPIERSMLELMNQDYQVYCRAQATEIDESIHEDLAVFTARAFAELNRDIWDNEEEDAAWAHLQ